MFLAIPSYGEAIHPTTARRAWKESGETVACRRGLSTSLLAHTFNICWTEALQAAKAGRVTHFAMLHSDIEPVAGWVDKMGEIMERDNLDVLSVVSPIKNNKGETSTAIDTDYWSPRKITMRDLESLPPTFTGEDIGGGLLINTGCMMVDLRNEEVLATNDDNDLELYFEINDKIHVEDNGHMDIRVASEDWNFSRSANRLGLRVAATTEIPLLHWGHFGYSNQPRRRSQEVTVVGGPLDGERLPEAAGKMVDGCWTYWRHGRAVPHEIQGGQGKRVARYCGPCGNSD